MDNDDDMGWTLVWPKPKRGPDDDTEELPVIREVDRKQFCTRCFLNRKRVDYGFANRKPFWTCPGCNDAVEED